MMNLRFFAQATFLRVLFAATLIPIPLAVTLAQAPDGAYVKKETPKLNRARGLNILKQLKEILERRYYDETFGGLDLDAKFKSAEERIASLERNADIHRTIADVLVGLNDSHTVFYPPDLLYRVQYGFSMMMVGNGCFVADVDKDSDAYAQGLRAGDQILEFSGHGPTRQNFWLINYIIYSLEPQPDIKLKVRGWDEKEREILFRSKFISPEERKKERKKLKDDEQAKPYFCVPIGSEVTACKLRTFEVEKHVIDKMMKEVLLRKKLILDLRGNRGGYVDAETHLIGWFFDHDVKIGTEKARNKSKERFAKGRKNDAFKGDVILLIDSESASAAEVVSRVFQIEKRGRVVGDASMGAVMTSRRYGIATDARPASMYEINVPYYLSRITVSVGDLIMSDGSRLEGLGVVPDTLVGPTQRAIFERSDPVLAYAAELLGAPITAETAGKFYFLVPKQESGSDKSDDDISEK